MHLTLTFIRTYIETYIISGTNVIELSTQICKICTTGSYIGPQKEFHDALGVLTFEICFCRHKWRL